MVCDYRAVGIISETRRQSNTTNAQTDSIHDGIRIQTAILHKTAYAKGPHAKAAPAEGLQSRTRKRSGHKRKLQFKEKHRDVEKLLEESKERNEVPGIRILIAGERPRTPFRRFAQKYEAPAGVAFGHDRLTGRAGATRTAGATRNIAATGTASITGTANTTKTAGITGITAITRTAGVAGTAHLSRAPLPKIQKRETRDPFGGVALERHKALCLRDEVHVDAFGDAIADGLVAEDGIDTEPLEIISEREAKALWHHSPRNVVGTQQSGQYRSIGLNPSWNRPLQGRLRRSPCSAGSCRALCSTCS